MGVRRKRWRWVACGPDPPSAETVHGVLRELDHGVLGLTHSETGVGVLLVRVLREQLGDALATLDLAMLCLVGDFPGTHLVKSMSHLKLRTNDIEWVPGRCSRRDSNPGRWIESPS